MKNMKLSNALAVLLLTLLLGGLVPLNSWAMSLNEFYINLLDLREAAQEATLDCYENLVDGNREDAATAADTNIEHLESILALIDQALSEGLISTSQKNILANPLRVALRDMQKAHDLIIDLLKTRDLILTGLQKVNKDNASIEKAIAKANLGIPTLWYGSNSAGFHSPGRMIPFTIRDLPSDCCDTHCVTVSIENPYSDLGIVPINPAVYGEPCTGQFQVAMAESLGGGRVVVNINGVERSWLLFNKSDTSITKSDFQGCYIGGFSGALTFNPDLGWDPQAVSGGVSFCVDELGRVTISAPGAGSGKISAKGGSNTTSGAGGLGVASARVAWRGSILIARDGTAYAGGTWAASFQGGKGAGTWSAGR